MFTKEQKDASAQLFFHIAVLNQEPPREVVQTMMKAFTKELTVLFMAMQDEAHKEVMSRAGVAASFDFDSHEVNILFILLLGTGLIESVDDQNILFRLTERGKTAALEISTIVTTHIGGKNANPSH